MEVEQNINEITKEYWIEEAEKKKETRKVSYMAVLKRCLHEI